MVNFMYKEKIIHNKESENSSLILSGLQNAVYEDHYKLQQFGLVLLKFQHTVQIGTDIVNDHGV